MLDCIAATAAIAIRIVISASVPGVLDLQCPTPSGWETYNNLAVLAEVNGVWNSAELNGHGISESAPGVFEYAPFDNGAIVTLRLTLVGARALDAEAIGSPNISRLAISNDYGLADRVRYAGAFDALSVNTPLDGPGVMGDFYSLPLGAIILHGDRLLQYQLADADEMIIEVRRRPWLPSQPDIGHNWIERVHLTRHGHSGTWRFGYLPRMIQIPMLAN